MTGTRSWRMETSDHFVTSRPGSPHQVNEKSRLRSVVIAAFSDVNGVMQAPGDPDGDPTASFEHGKWIPHRWDDATARAMEKTSDVPFG